jgi:DNA-binding NarL/FixJ family response regulator/anti-sigma regulatory factor (Ser/Thr protein kinase)
MEKVLRDGEKSDAGMQEIITSAREFVREALDTQWNSDAGSLRTQSETLESRIASELAWLEASANIETEFHIVGSRRVLAPEIEHHCFKVAQEALSNVITHSQAERVRVGLIFNSGSVSVVIEDNGVGFTVQNAHKDHASLRPKCLGLHDMAARVSRLNGDFSIESTEGWGTTVRAQVFDSSHSPTLEAGSPRWKIAIATRMPLISAGLIRLLSLYEPAIQVVAEIHNDSQFEETVKLVKPDIVAIDISMLQGELLGQLLAIREDMPDLPIIAITQNPTTEELYASSRAGVRGFLRADTDPATIVRTIVAAVQANTLLGGGAFENLTDYLSTELLADEPTQREFEVLKILCQGGSNQEIASQLHISIKTVEKHVSALLRKSGAENRTMLANLFLQKLSRF